MHLKLIDAQMLKAYRIARPKLLSIWPQLKKTGWTKDDLFRIGRFKYPLGHWGIAWYPVWLIPDLKTTLKKDGTIVFEWTERHKTVQQTARPSCYWQKYWKNNSSDNQQKNSNQQNKYSGNQNKYLTKSERKPERKEENNKKTINKEKSHVWKNKDTAKNAASTANSKSTTSTTATNSETAAKKASGNRHHRKNEIRQRLTGINTSK